MLQNGQQLCKLVLMPIHRHSQPTDIRISQITATAHGERFRKFSSQVNMQIHRRWQRLICMFRAVQLRYQWLLNWMKMRHSAVGLHICPILTAMPHIRLHSNLLTTAKITPSAHRTEILRWTMLLLHKTQATGRLRLLFPFIHVRMKRIIKHQWAQ